MRFLKADLLLVLMPRWNMCLTNAGAPQPSAPALPMDALQLGARTPATDTWLESLFFTELLPSQSKQFVNAFPHFEKYTTRREAINGACETLYDHLPLLATAFTDFDMSAALNQEGAIVVAERVVRVKDPNREFRDRVDFFCYKEDGEVIRCHPGHTVSSDMKSHSMPRGCLCFRMATAAHYGVGSSLHAEPPGLVHEDNLSLPVQDPAGAAQPGGSTRILVTAQQLEQVCPYDMKTISWTRLWKELDELPNYDETADWSDGKQFPWWLALGNSETLKPIVNSGITAVEVNVSKGTKCILVNTVGGIFK